MSSPRRAVANRRCRAPGRPAAQTRPARPNARRRQTGWRDDEITCSPVRPAARSPPDRRSPSPGAVRGPTGRSPIRAACLGQQIPDSPAADPIQVPEVTGRRSKYLGPVVQRMEQVDLAQQPDMIGPRPQLRRCSTPILSQEMPVRIQPPLRPRTTGRRPTRMAGTGPASIRRPLFGVTGISSTCSPSGSPGSSWSSAPASVPAAPASDSCHAAGGAVAVSGRSRMRPLLAASARCRSDVACSVRISRNAVMAIAKTCLQFVTTGQLQTPFKRRDQPRRALHDGGRTGVRRAVGPLHPAADPKRVLVQRNLDDGAGVHVVRRPGERHPIGEPGQAQGGDPRAIADGGRQLVRSVNGHLSNDSPGVG